MLKRFLLAAFLLLAAALPAVALQSNGCMPLTGTVTGVQLSENINTAFANINSMNSGPTAPATDCSAATVVGQEWLDTSGAFPVWRVWDGTAGLGLAFLDTTNHLLYPVIGGGVATLTAAATTDLCAGVPQDYLTIGGATTITSFGTSCAVGQIKFLSFAGATPITFGSGSILTQTSQSLTTASGDQAQAVYLGGGVWRLLNYQIAAGPRVYFGGASMSSNAFTAGSMVPTDFALQSGVRVTIFSGASPNTGAATLNVAGTGVKNILKIVPGGATALTGNEINGVIDAIYDGTEYLLLNEPPFPAGAIVAFNASSCPAGWIASNGSNGTVDARGVVLRGQDNGRGINPAGTVAIGTFQAHALQQHEHSVSLSVLGPAVSGAFGAAGGAGCCAWPSGGQTISGNTFGVIAGANVDTETRMSNATVLYCQKL